MMENLECSSTSVEGDGKWLFSQFQDACKALLKRSPHRRGPFLIEDIHIPQLDSHQSDLTTFTNHVIGGLADLKQGNQGE